MEIFFPQWISTLSLCLTFLFLAIVILSPKKNKMIFFTAKAEKRKLPPGPRKLPIIGNMHQLLTEQPHRRLHRLAMIYGPLMHLKLGQINVMVISSIELAREVMKTHDSNFCSRPLLLASKVIFYNGTDMAFAPYGKYWSQIRKISSLELLGTKRVKSFCFIREEEGNKLVKKLRRNNGSAVNLSQMFQALTNKIVARSAFGKECAHRKKFLLMMMEVLKYVSGFDFVDIFPSLSFVSRIIGSRSRMEKAHQSLDEILSEIFGEHQAKQLRAEDGAADGHEDVVDVLLRVQKQGNHDVSLTMDNIKAVVLDLFIAGTHTTSTTLEWAMTELIRHPKVMEKAQNEVRSAFEGRAGIEEKDTCRLPYLQQVIKETLRLRPVAPLLMHRLCQDTIEMKGWTIPAGSHMVINAATIMKDPTVWDEPESFRPDRFEGNPVDYRGDSFEYIPFGSGRRICPGIAFAMVGIELWLAQLLFHFDWQLLDGMTPQDLDVEENFGCVVSKKNNLKLIPVPRF